MSIVQSLLPFFIVAHTLFCRCFYSRLLSGILTAIDFSFMFSRRTRFWLLSSATPLPFCSSLLPYDSLVSRITLRLSPSNFDRLNLHSAALIGEIPSITSIFAPWPSSIPRNYPPGRFSSSAFFPHSSSSLTVLVLPPALATTCPRPFSFTAAVASETMRPAEALGAFLISWISFR